MRPSETEEFLGVDVGAKRVGLARGSAAARLAEPLKTVKAENALEEIKQLVVQYHTGGIVVGLPRGLEGQETDQTKAIRDWVASSKTKIKLPFYWQDEALSSVVSPTTEKGLDAEAAALILQDFLDTPLSQRVRC